MPESGFAWTELNTGIAMDAANKLCKFVIEGGESPLVSDSFAPCLFGRQEPISQRNVLQFHFADTRNDSCFRH